LSHVARKFESLLEAYRPREGGGKWSGGELERATGGVVTRSYVTNLRKGRIDNPGMDKLAAIAKATGFPPLYGSRKGYLARGDEEPRGRPRGSRTGSVACSRSSRTRRREKRTPAPASPV
jgi:transcriptional regulator with XRE-family HTH domain